MEAANASAISRSSLGEGKHTSTAHLRSDLITYSGAAWEIYIAMHIPDTEAARATARSRSSWDSFAFTSTHQERSQNKGEHGGGVDIATDKPATEAANAKVKSLSSRVRVRVVEGPKKLGGTQIVWGDPNSWGEGDPHSWGQHR